MIGYGIQHQGTQGMIVQQFFADCRVRLEQGKFVFAQTTGFVQDLIGNPDFADVMNKSA
jgi:hypothetical protein